MSFITSERVMGEAFARGFATAAEEADIRSYLDAYDVALDGAFDGGFRRRQVHRDLYVTVDHDFSRFASRTGHLNRIIYEMFHQRDAKPTQSNANTTGEDSIVLAGLGVLLKVALLPLMVSGCGDGSNLHRCEDVDCEGDCNWCTYDDPGKEICTCPFSLCHWDEDTDSCQPNREPQPRVP